MIAVFYKKETGVILGTVQGLESNIQRDGRDYLEVPSFKHDYDVTHKVVDGQLVQIEE